MVFISREVIESTNSLGYLRMLTFKTQVDSTKLNRRGQSAIKAMAAKGIETSSVSATQEAQEKESENHTFEEVTMTTKKKKKKNQVDETHHNKLCLGHIESV